MFDLQDILLNIYECSMNNEITAIERENLIERAMDKYIDNYITSFDAYYLEGFFDKLAKKNARKDYNSDEVKEKAEKIKAKKGKLSEHDKKMIVSWVAAGAISLAYALTVVGYQNRDAIIAAIDNRKTYVDNPTFSDELFENISEYVDEGDFISAKLCLFESGMSEVLSEAVFDLIYHIILEAEEDHWAHMKQKEIAAKNTGKDLDKLPNKKYKTKKDGTLVDPEKAAKADMKYNFMGHTQYKDDDWRQARETDPVDNSEISGYKPTPSDLKMLQYMKDRAEKGDPESIKNYKRVFKMFCVKHGIKETSSLYVRYSPKKLGLTEWKEGKKLTSKEMYGKENLHVIPKGYCLLHTSDANGIKELKPKAHSERYISDDEEKVTGQYHASGRIYFVLQKEHNIMQRLMGKKDQRHTGEFGGGGTHLYRLISPVSGFYIDGENGRTKGLDKNASLDKLVGKAVYVKTDKPLKVRQLK